MKSLVKAHLIRRRIEATGGKCGDHDLGFYADAFKAVSRRRHSYRIDTKVRRGLRLRRRSKTHSIEQHVKGQLARCTLKLLLIFFGLMETATIAS